MYTASRRHRPVEHCKHHHGCAQFWNWNVNAGLWSLSTCAVATTYYSTM